MKYNLLEMTQRILESMESDEVSTFSETPESLTVANIIKECYFDIIGQHSPAESEGLYKLDASTDNTKPVLMTIPSNVSRIVWLRYDTSTDVQNMTDMRYVPNEEFFYMQTNDDNQSNKGSMTVDINNKEFSFTFYKDRMPSYYTIFSDKYVVFDAYDSSIEDTLTESRTVIWAELVPVFLMEDTFIPDLDPRQFQLLLNEAKAQAFVELKQSQNPKAEQKARKNHILTQKNKRDNDPRWANQQHVQFGRNGRNGFPRDWVQRAMRRGR